MPEHLKKLETPHVAHPGCFATSILLASVPLLSLGLVEPTLFVSGVTGSTGSGRKPVEGTHHPAAPQRSLLLQRAGAPSHAGNRRRAPRPRPGVEAEFAFVPHSGPFARGIHMTVQARLKSPVDTQRVLRGAARVLRALAVRARDGRAPRASKRLSRATTRICPPQPTGKHVAVMCAVDNLNKGAAGGAVQWMNRMFGLPETAGLTAPAPGWT